MTARCLQLLNHVSGPEGRTFDLRTCSQGVLGVLFAGKWCEPCEEFIGLLKQCYDKVRERGVKFEVVYVSADKEREDFDYLTSLMPWWWIDFDDLENLSKMRRLFKIQDVPYLGLVDISSGQTLVSNACQLVRQDPEGAAFPWQPRSYDTLMAEESLVDREGRSRPYRSIQAGYKALYFAANWCPPCKAFTPELCEVRDRVRSAGHKFEVILVSSDRTEESFDLHLSTMPWLAVPYADSERRRELAERFGVQGIPSLILLDDKDQLVCRNARNCVVDDPLAERFPWQAPVIEELTEAHTHCLEDELCVLFVDPDIEEMKFARQVLSPAAEMAQRYRTDQTDVIHFFIATDSDVAEQVRETAGVDDTVPQLVVIDLVLGHRHVLEDGVALTAERVVDFLDRWRRRLLPAVPFDKL